ncbi:Glycosyltransferase, GT2 family [Nakamurella panacisegetis]|uniref:Glycosyltransferase, GT2 family n=1 Tax=Nakamurella panacisegetis TaxID=1090615 RepID=A0A1H0IIG9_9ACTN|nr:glycosyltransferase family A protein [Nakamurella panacisegetis]SDO31244.1 Glycosyltransferase, GT2 family [Nakamurella panacisegetis]
MSASVGGRSFPTVTVAMATYQRVDRLASVLPALTEQASRLAPPARIVVVDNDAGRSAEDAMSSWLGPLVHYVCEPTPGIAAARNRAIDEAVGSDLLVFLDDDEMPCSNWLVELVSAWQRWGCAAVAGPVHSRFATTPEPWIVASGVFDPIDRADGQRLGGAASNNLLLDLGQLRRTGLRFAPEFGLSGGSDTMLTHEMVRRGLEIRWCATARVIEDVPSSRLSRRWVRRRTVRTSNDWSRVAIALADRPIRERADLTARAALRAVQGLARRVKGTLTGQVSDQARGDLALASAWGMLIGAYGVTKIEYGRDAPRATPRSR